MRAPDRPTVPFAVPAALPDQIELLEPADVSLRGYLGDRVQGNDARLASVDLEPMVAGFRQRPGSHPWIGEHIGKWLHAATLAWHRSGDPVLRARIDEAVRQLIATQEPDGYLGTYSPDRRFGMYEGANWDVWVHKYVLLGLLTYHRYTGDEPALAASRRVVDLLERTFGSGPGRRSILSAGTHVGMAATSVLEPVVLLHRLTGEERYLAFAKYLVESWDEPDGPRILASLREVGQVQEVANGKAYEMLSNLVGLCELARVTGDRSYLTPALMAWSDITENHLYLSGTASQGERFHAPHELPNDTDAKVGETCVTVTWLQLNIELLRLTGEARFGDELERTAYNHLAAAQRPDGLQWCYFTALEGAKDYGPGISCCVSSGPRGIALLPTLVYGSMSTGGLVINLFESSSATIRLGAASVRVEQESPVPGDGGSSIRLSASRPVSTSLVVRPPSWADRFRIREHPAATINARGWIEVERLVLGDDTQVHVDFESPQRSFPGEYGNAGKVVLTNGPFVMAFESDAGNSEDPGRIVPFADAGAGGSRYRIWMPTELPKVLPPALS